jgi:hypothetical protein
VRQAIAGTQQAQPFDHDRWGIRYRNYQSYSTKLALDSFTGLRMWNLALLENLEPEQWQLVVHHPIRSPETLAL